VASARFFSACISLVAWAASSPTTRPVSLPGAAASVQSSAEAPQDLAAACRQAGELLGRQLGPACRVLVSPPYVLAGDLSERQLRYCLGHVIEPASRALWRKFFRVRPDRPVTLLLFRDADSYRHYARFLYGDEPTSRYGYFKPERWTIVANAGTGMGTVVHELTHALVRFDFPRIPDWFDEGLASLYEQCSLAGGDIRGLVNWRLPVLQEAIRQRRVPTLEGLVRTAHFRGPGEGVRYAYARYFCLYLQERGLLGRFYRRFRDHHAEDPTGERSLQVVLGNRPLQHVHRDFLAWVQGLDYRPRGRSR